MKTTEIARRLSMFRGARLNPHERFEDRICAFLFRRDADALYWALTQGSTTLVQTRFHDHPDAGERFIDVTVSGNPDRVRVAVDYNESRDYADHYQLGEVIAAGKLATCPCETLPARVTYEKACKPAGETYDAACAAARETYEKACAAARETYAAACAVARKAYVATRDVRPRPRRATESRKGRVNQ